MFGVIIYIRDKIGSFFKAYRSISFPFLLVQVAQSSGVPSSLTFVQPTIVLGYFYFYPICVMRVFAELVIHEMG